MLSRVFRNAFKARSQGYNRLFSTAAEKIRNVAIIAHVDHGKTTLVDQLLKLNDSNSEIVDRLLDSKDLERERGITIMSKCTRVQTADNNHVLNIVDTPGHADFGGEVERILSMVDGVVLVVDATEGPMSQTKFVLTKALANGLKPLVVINKVDRPTSRIEDGSVENEIFDLFVALDASDEQLEFPVLYASAKNGWATLSMDEINKTDGVKNMDPLVSEIISHVPSPVASTNKNAPFSMAVTMIGHDSYVGRLATGRITSGSVAIGDPITVLKQQTTSSSPSEETEVETVKGKVTQMFVTAGVAKTPITSAVAGDIVTIAGVPAFVSDTICNPEVTTPLDVPALDPPTITMTFAVNDSPLAGKGAGKFVTASNILDRLTKETQNNVAVSITKREDSEAYDVHGRGELQLAILIEEMRREGYEISVSAPRVLLKKSKTNSNTMEEPVEEVTIDVDSEYSGNVIDKMSTRGGEIKEFIEMKSAGDKVRLVFTIPSRGLLGYRSEIKTDTRGSGILNSIFYGYQKYTPSSALNASLIKGKLVSSATGKATAYALNMLESRGEMFITPGVEVYEGMVIGEHSRAVDLDVNPTKEKKLTNMRASGTDEGIRLSPARQMSLEDIVTYIAADEVMDITPKDIRIRKRELDSGRRLRDKKAGRT